LVDFLFSNAKRIQVRGKHLDNFETLDTMCVVTNKFVTVVFVYHLVQV
jgi:hypothetical protein